MSRFRMSVPLLLILLTVGSVLGVVIALVLTGWLSLEHLDNLQETVSNDTLEDLAHNVTEHTNSLVLAGANLIAASTPEKLEEVSASIAADKAAMVEQLEILEGTSHEDRLERIRNHVGLLSANIELIEGGRPEMIRLIAEGGEHTHRSLGLLAELDAAISTSLDDQFYYMMTGNREFAASTQASAGPIFKEDLANYRYIASLRADTIHAAGLLSTAGAIRNAALVGVLQEDYRSASHRIKDSLEHLPANDDLLLTPEVASLARLIIEAGEGEDNFFESLEARLQQTDEEMRLIEANKEIGDELIREINALFEDVREISDDADEASAETVARGRNILLGLGAIDILGTLLAGWYFVFRSWLRMGQEL